MKILYGVVGAGMGHATRSRVIVDHLLAQGHYLRIVVSGRACRFFQNLYAGSPNVEIQPIEGLFMVFEDDSLALGTSIRQNLAAAPRSLHKNLAAYRKLVHGFEADVVFSDFESWSYLYGLLHGVPVISIDNMQAIARCRLDPEQISGQALSYRLARAAVKLKLPGAYYYLISSFFRPAVRKARTAIVPPILRPEILAAKRERGEHVLVYQSGIRRGTLQRVLSGFPQEFRVYGLGEHGKIGNVEYRGFSEKGFVDDLRTARAAVATGGYSLMGECVHLGVPLLALPIHGQFEQVLNARNLEKLGYGACADSLSSEALAGFLQQIPRCERALLNYRRADNQLLLACVDELLHSVECGRPAPVCLRTKALRRLRKKLALAA